MKQLLRKRTTSTSAPAPPPSSSTHQTASNTNGHTNGNGAQPSTPLYARFATAHRARDRPIVSGPLALAPRARGTQSPQPTQPAAARAGTTQSPHQNGDAQGRGTHQEKFLDHNKGKSAVIEKDREMAERAKGERVLLPARKVVGGGGARSPEPERSPDKRPQAPREPQHPSPSERVLLPARKVAGRRAEEEAREASAVKEHSRVGGPRAAREGEKEEERDSGRHAEGERVLLPARKVTRKKAEGDPATSASVSTALSSSAPRDTHEAHPRVAFPTSPSTSMSTRMQQAGPGSASTRAVVIHAVSDGEGEDKFSRPKRVHVQAATTDANANASARAMIDANTNTNTSMAAPMVSRATTSTPPSLSGTPMAMAAQANSDPRLGRAEMAGRSEANWSTVSSATTSTQPSSASGSGSHSRGEMEERGRALLAGRKWADRGVESEGEGVEREEGGARGRKGSTQGQARLSREVRVGVDVEGARAEMGVGDAALGGMPSAERNFSGAVDDDVHGLGKPSGSDDARHSQDADGTTSSSSPGPSGEIHGRIGRRRKYSLLAAFGLQTGRAGSESDSKAPAPSASYSSSISTAAAGPSSAAPKTAAHLTRIGDENLAESHLRSLHLSGFNFPLDIILGDGQDATHDIPVPVRDTRLLPEEKQDPKDRRVTPHPPSPFPSPSDPPPRDHPIPASSPPPPIPSSTQGPPQPSPPSIPPTTTTTTTAPAYADPSPHSLPSSSAHQPHKHKRRPSARAIHLEHSLLSPESDTRYPIPRRSNSARTRNLTARSTSPPPTQNPASDWHPSPPAPTYQDPSAMHMNPDPSQRGLVQGRPLIFAAMAAAELEAEIARPTAWMAVNTHELHPLDAPHHHHHHHQYHHTPAHTEHSNGSSQFINGYPTPRSSSPKLPTLAPPEIKWPIEGQPLAPASASKRSNTGSEPVAVAVAEYPATDNYARHPSPSPYPQSPLPTSSLPSPPDTHRPRKLSKSRPRVTDAMPLQPHPQPHSHLDSVGRMHAPSSTLGAKPPTPVDDAPPLRTREGPSRGVPKPTHPSANGTVPAASSAVLGSPFQVRTERDKEKDKVAAQRGDPSSSSSSSSSSSRIISSESAVPTRPVKVLTERQMEKLSATKGVATYGANGNGGVHDSQRRHEHAGPMRSPPLRPQPWSSSSSQTPSEENANEAPPRAPATPPPKGQSPLEDQTLAPSTPQKAADPGTSRDPDSPDSYAEARARRRGKALEKVRPEGIEDVVAAADSEPEDLKEPTFYPLAQHVAEPALFGALLGYLSFREWLALASVCKGIRTTLYQERALAEIVLERYLRVVGYARWAFAESEPLVLNLTDLNAYMHGISIPAHQYSRFAETYFQTKGHREWEWTRSLAAACRSFTRVVLRLRAQAEAEARIVREHERQRERDRTRSPPRRTQAWDGSMTSVHTHGVVSKASTTTFSRGSSRAPSPTSMFSRSYHGHGGYHSRNGSSGHSHSTHGHTLHHSQSIMHLRLHGMGAVGSTFQSPLFRLRRAPLLQVYVPSPEGEWLSDESVLECEQELKRAGVLHLLRPGDVVWDTAVGDEGNMGRMVWDGSYLLDLDYTYSRAGDLPKYLPTLAFPPSYFHRVIRTMGNPICHMDISPWGEEIAAHLQLLQDRMKTETPQGGHHVVVRWVHRSFFTVTPSGSGKPPRVSVPRSVGPGPGPGGAWLVDPGWYGTVVVETEGTNEGLADLQERCRGAFPVRAKGANPDPVAGVSPERQARMEERRSVFKILREKSRPGEIWIKTVTEKDRLLPP